MQQQDVLVDPVALPLTGRTVNSTLALIIYCVFCFGVSALMSRVIATTWVYLLTSATIPPVALVTVEALRSGYIDAWADIAFFVGWLIALVCAVVYYCVARARRGRAES